MLTIEILSHLFKLKGTCIEVIIGAFFFDELFMVAAFNDFAMVKHHNDIGVFDSREAVGNHKDSAADHELIHATLDDGFGAGIN